MEFKNISLSSLSEAPSMFAFASGDYYATYEYFDQDNIQMIQVKCYFSLRSTVDRW